MSEADLIKAGSDEAASRALTALIRHEIKRTGPISVARFMELALYAPGLGYYEKKRAIGRKGDFYTSVSVGNVFGELLALQFAHWLDTHPSLTAHVQIVEAGAHDGQLAFDILSFLRRHRPSLFSRLQYCIIEPSAERRAWQHENLLEQFGNIKWIESVGDLAAAEVRGVIFTNELFDAMPAHRLAWSASDRKWREWQIGCDREQFSWRLAALPTALENWIPRVPAELEEVLPEQFTIEISPQGIQWWEQAAGALRAGTLMTIDYGLTQEELIVPQRRDGTLRAYFKHHPASSLFDNIGEQDITAHVNFSALQSAGERAGLKTMGLISQCRFLTEIVRLCQSDHRALGLSEASRARQFATLTHPNHLGERFRVLQQVREHRA